MSALDYVKLGIGFFDTHPSIGFVLFMLFLGLIQITPIKINPWTWIGKQIRAFGRHMLGDTLERLDEIEKKLEDVSEAVDENEIDRIRSEIIAFSSSLQRGVNHTEREFRRIFTINDKYHKILARIGESNGEIDREMEYIAHVDAEKKEHDSYLK